MLRLRVLLAGLLLAAAACDSAGLPGFADPPLVPDGGLDGGVEER